MSFYSGVHALTLLGQHVHSLQLLAFRKLPVVTLSPKVWPQLSFRKVPPCNYHIFVVAAAVSPRL